MELPRDEAMRLLNCVCTFAWADLQVTDEERMLVARLADRMALSDEDKGTVAGWLAHPPRDDVDPTDIPLEHRRLFLDTALEMIAIDGDIDPAEIETYALFEALLPGA